MVAYAHVVRGITIFSPETYIHHSAPLTGSPVHTKEDLPPLECSKSTARASGRSRDKNHEDYAWLDEIPSLGRPTTYCGDVMSGAGLKEGIMALRIEETLDTTSMPRNVGMYTLHQHLALDSWP